MQCGYSFDNQKISAQKKWKVLSVLRKRGWLKQEHKSNIRTEQWRRKINTNLRHVGGNRKTTTDWWKAIYDNMKLTENVLCRKDSVKHIQNDNKSQENVQTFWNHLKVELIDLYLEITLSELSYFEAKK